MEGTHYGDKTKKLRLERGWPQEQLAEISGISVRTIQRIESGQPASAETLKAIWSAFDIDVKELLKEKSPSKKEKLDIDFLIRLNSGRDLFNVVGNSHVYRFDNDDLENEEEVELVSCFLQDVHDWGELWNEIEPGEKIKIEYRFTERIKELEGYGFWVFGLRKKGRFKFPSNLISDEEKTISMISGTVYVTRSTNPMIIKFPESKESISVKQEGER